MRPALPCLLAFALLAACASFPELEAARATREDAAAAYPRLVPIEELLAMAEAQPERSEAASQGLAARASALRARAAALSARAVIEPAARRRLLDAMQGSST